MTGDPVSDIEESPGVVSMMRKEVRAAGQDSRFMLIAAAGLSVGMLVVGRYELIPVVTALVIGAPSLRALALGAKAWQAQAEGRTPPQPVPVASGPIVQNYGR